MVCETVKIDRHIQAAPSAPFCVRFQADITSTLDINRSQIISLTGTAFKELVNNLIREQPKMVDLKTYNSQTPKLSNRLKGKKTIFQKISVFDQIVDEVKVVYHKNLEHRSSKSLGIACL